MKKTKNKTNDTTATVVATVVEAAPAVAKQPARLTNAQYAAMVAAGVPLWHMRKRPTWYGPTRI